MVNMDLGVENASVFENIFRDFDSFVVSRVMNEPMRRLDDLKIEDQRIASLIREKDAEIYRLRDRLVGVEQTRTLGGVHDAHARAVKVLQDEILNLKNENLALRGEKSSAELVANYREQIGALNNRILELEQEKSDLTAELSNLRREYEVRLRLGGADIIRDEEGGKRTIYSGVDKSRSPGQTTGEKDYSTVSPVQQYGGMGSPDIKMVQSSYREGGEESSRGGATYGATDRLSSSGYSSGSGVREETGGRTSYGEQGKESSYTRPGTSASGLTGGFNQSGSGFNQSGSVNRPGTSGEGYQGTTYGSGSGMQQSGSYGSGNMRSSGTYGSKSPTGGQSQSTSQMQGGTTYTSGTYGTGQSSSYGTNSGYRSPTGGDLGSSQGSSQQGQQGGNQQGGNQQGGNQQGGSQQGGSRFSSSYGSTYKYEKK